MTGAQVIQARQTQAVVLGMIKISMMERITFNKNKLAVSAKLSSVLLEDVRATTGLDAFDLVKDQLTVQLVAGFMTALNETKNITVYAERPTFLDWLLRRKRRFVLTVNAKEILKDPPKVESGILMYELKEPC